MLHVCAQVGVNADETKTLLITKEANENVMLAGRNVEKLYINTADAIKIFDVLKAHKIVIEEDALAHINSFYGEASA